MKNILELRENWNEIILKLKQHSVAFTDDDLCMDDNCYLMEGMEAAFLKRLGNKLGKTKKEIQGFIKELLKPDYQVGHE